MPVKYSKELTTKIINNYNSGLSIAKISKLMKLDRGTISKTLKENNIIIRSNRKHNFHIDFFEKIDSERKAYWLGFIYADGTLSSVNAVDKFKSRTTLNISSKDLNHLEIFAEDLNYDKNYIRIYTPKGTYSQNPMCRLDLNSRKMCSDLEYLGLDKLKSDRTSIPTNYIPDKLINHFIRGFFDGDGSICSYTTQKHNYKMFSFSIIGVEPILEKIQHILMSHCNLNKTKLIPYPHKSINVFNLSYGGTTQVNRIYNYLYQDASIFLARKKEVFELYISE
ncbi:MAG: hypothetical protein ACRCX2_06290 [Paraclostridium sp.]